MNYYARDTAIKKLLGDLVHYGSISKADAIGQILNNAIEYDAGWLLPKAEITPEPRAALSKIQIYACGVWRYPSLS